VVLLADLWPPHLPGFSVMKNSLFQYWFVLAVCILLGSCITTPEPTQLPTLVESADSADSAESAENGFTESEYDGIFGLSYYDYRDATIQWFGARGMQGGGYTWEALVRAAFELEPSPLSNQIELDSEGGAFNAYVQSEEARAVLKQTIEKLVNDMDFRVRSLEHAEQGGYLE